MKSMVFKNLMEIGFADEDVAIYYNKHFSNPKTIELYKALDDCFSVLIDAKFISRDEIEEDLINYYETHIKNTPFTMQHLKDYQNSDNFENNIK